jgi:DNA uptake protein ComE-like DNA-binding protein
MIRTLIAAALGAAALAGGQYYVTGAVPFLEAPQPVPVAQAAPVPPSAPQAVPTAAGDGSAVVLSCTPQRAAEAPAQAAKAQEQAAGLVNLNTATVAELDALPEVGRARLELIKQARPIRSIDELAGPGMPASVIAMLKARATV